MVPRPATHAIHPEHLCINVLPGEVGIDLENIRIDVSAAIELCRNVPERAGTMPESQDGAAKK